MLSAAKPMALKAVVLLNVPDILAIHGNGNPLSVEEMAAHISSSTGKPAHTNYLFRILRFLASIKVFSEESTAIGDGTTQFKYGLTHISKFLVKHKNEYCSAPFRLVPNQKAGLNGFQHLQESVIERCDAFSRANGMSFYEYNCDNPEANTIFNEGMAGHTRAVMASLFKMYDGFKNVKSVVDVRGGVGSALALILAQHPHLHGITFDLPHGIRASSPVLSE
ncbi:caffeic acid 3-O-methyltransferase-like [Cryptomeria japonica]|uniref:caffeic acid 3-O-methyltransferase-like n=1 Tax=Cryptomeria japonica TaxID=3369 RepID=UPI0027DA70FF|nr:caffeic acid 3-O-methyltransferase-like [Cryptomeria japonica]